MARSFLSSSIRSLQHLLLIRLLLHVDEVDDDDAAHVAQSELAHDLVDGLEIGLHHRVFEAALADVLAGVDVDGDKRLGLVDDQVPTGLEPDLGFQRLVELLLDLEEVEDRRLLLIVLDLVDHRRVEAGRRSERRADTPASSSTTTRSKSSAKTSRNRRNNTDRSLWISLGALGILRAALDLLPGFDQEHHVVLEVLLVLADTRGARDQPADVLGSDVVDDLAQAVALVAVGDLARDAGVIDGRHVDEKAARQRDVGGDAGALGAERRFRDLNQDLVALAQQIFDALPFAGAAAATLARLVLAAALVLIAFHPARELFDLGEDVGDVEKPVAFEADVDEGRLHPGQDPADATFVDVADQPARLSAFQKNFG